MKRRLGTLERNWLDNKVDECRVANESGDMGSVYRILRQLGTRNCKPNTGTTIKTDEFKAHFEKVKIDTKQTQSAYSEQCIKWRTRDAILSNRGKQ